MAKNKPVPPYIFDEFFASGLEESISPFLTPSSLGWGKNLPLKSALLAALCLSIAYALSFYGSCLSPIFLLFCYFLTGTPALIGAIQDMTNLEINIDVLMTFAALLSVLIGSGFEGGLLLVLFELSAAMEGMVSEKTKGALSHLHELSPKTACLITEEGTLIEKSAKEIPLGAKILIKTGEIAPLDGIIVDGNCFVNLFHLTGESLPVAKKVGDEVQAGARTLDASITITVTKTSSNSTLSRIISLITEAQGSKPKLQRFLDRFGKWYATSIIALFFFFALTLPLFTSLPYLGKEGGIYRSLAFLIAASPCALILATPTAYLSAISACAKQGILLKGGVIFDALDKCTTIAFDKTGTLTTGKLQLTSIEPLHATTPIQRALEIAYALERHAIHPIAQAIIHYAQNLNLQPASLSAIQVLAGAGLKAQIDLLPLAIGHAEFITSVLPPSLHTTWQQLLPTLHKEGHLNTFLLIGQELFVFHFLDTLRPQVPELIATLQDTLKLRTLMLTGDRQEIAASVAKQAGITEFYANLRPENKLQQVEALSKTGGLIMIGDGINDAPALARATVGISMGKIGSATAVDASDIVFLSDDLALTSHLLNKARQTTRIIHQNLSIALLVILSATTPALLGLVPLWAAVILHEGGTVLVGLNSLRLLRWNTLPAKKN